MPRSNRLSVRAATSALFPLIGLLGFAYSLTVLGPPPKRPQKRNPLEAGVNFNPAKAKEIRANPDRYAWKVFIALNKPQSSPGNNNVVWENWIDSGLVYDDPNNKPKWPEGGNAPIKYDLKINLASRVELSLDPSQKSVAQEPGLPRYDGELEEIRMNRATFNYIVRNKLWYLEGQQEAAKSGEDLSFPPESIEVKAVWKTINPQDRPYYHSQKILGEGQSFQNYGLVALHITTRDIPNWFWATFEHVDNPRRGKSLPSKDRFGLSGTRPSPAVLAMFKKAGLGSEWQNYRLEGSQFEFTDGAGKPTLVGNSEIEGVEFEDVMKSSSCITCHARSAVDREGKFPDPYRRRNPFQGYIGPSNSRWFLNASGKKRYMQRDFVWSLSRARCQCISLPSQSFKSIVKLFTPHEISCMAPYGVYLDRFDWMSNPVNAQRVYDRLTMKGPRRMPLGAPWPKYKIDKFKAWMDGGRKP